MSRSMLVAVLAGVLGGCAVDCPSEAHSDVGFAPQGVFQNQIDTCVDQHACARLCMDVFTLDYGSDTIVKCQVVDRTAQGATVHVEYLEEGVCEASDVDIDVPDVSDDGSDDGTVGDDGSGDGTVGDDGSGDDGSTGDDGSGDDGSGDDGGTDDGSAPRTAGGRVHVAQPATKSVH